MSGVSTETGFRNDPDKKEGDLQLTNSGDLLAVLGGNVETLFRKGSILNNVYGELFIGDHHIQFGRVVSTGTTVTVTYPKAFRNNNVFAFIQEANNDSSYQAKLDGSNPPNSTRLVIISNKVPTGSAHCYWLVIGTKAQ